MTPRAIDSAGAHLNWRGLVIPAALLAAWYAATRFHLANPELLVPLPKIWHTAVDYTVSGKLWTNLSASLARNLIAFSIGSAIGLAVGSAMGLSRLADRFAGPTFHALKGISLFAWVPLISVWFGLGNVGKVAFISLAALYPVALNTYEGVRSVQREHIEVATVFMFNRWQLLTKVILPAASPSIFTGVHLALIYSWLATIGAEYLLIAGPGIGTLMIDGREHFWMDQVLLGVVLVGLVGWTLNTIAGRVEAHFLRWRGTS